MALPHLAVEGIDSWFPRALSGDPTADRDPVQSDDLEARGVAWGRSGVTRERPAQDLTR